MRAFEEEHVGAYNAVGPAKTFGIGDLLGEVKDAIGSSANLTWGDADFLEAQKVSPWGDMPVWIRPEAKMRG